MHIDLGKMPGKGEACCGEVAKASKPKKYYPSAWMDDIGDINIDDLTIDKDMDVHMTIRITSASKKKRKDGGGTKETVDLNFEMRSVDFNPGDKKKKEHKAADGDSIHDAIIEALD